MDIKSILSGVIGADVFDVPFGGHLLEELDLVVDARIWQPRYLPITLRTA
ncbi:MAG: hypothetical protein ACLQIB_49640 [Isosphaeraceae bacterium]